MGEFGSSFRQLQAQLGILGLDLISHLLVVVLEDSCSSCWAAANLRLEVGWLPYLWRRHIIWRRDGEGKT